MYLTQGLHRWATATPGRVATICGDRSRTYAELSDRVSRLASGLRGIDIKDGDRVGVLALNSDRYIESLFAVPWANAVLNPVNIRWSPAEIAYSLEDSQTRVLIVDDVFAPAVPAVQQIYPALTTVIHAGDGPTPDFAISYEQLIAESDPIADARRSGDELAGVFYTGGTTGAPKGVMLSHTNLVSAALGGLASGNFFRHGATPRSLHVAPMFHLADFAFFLMTSIAGGTNIAVPMFDPQKVLGLIGTHEVTDTLLVPTMIQMLADHPSAPSFDVSHLRTIAYGASPISPALLGRAKKVWPGVDFVQAYGMTELSALATILPAADHSIETRQRSAGATSPTSEIRIAAEDGTDAPRGAVGEILVRGPQVMRGYWQKPEETEEALRDGWMHTGDAGYLDDDGYLYIVDRLKDMIITGGENVYSSEVENALAQHPAVAACAVIGLPDERWGERVHAVVVPAPQTTVTADELQEHTRALIAGYKVPRSVSFAESLPISGAGKILKRSLRDTVQQQPSA
ncbi:acyl-CoA synthetase [Hoyosella subflava]|uniref:Feruloyl-CoA synthetase n=1 Tax=Hoyosella subflava (strain DSM 45089 / JCM 17490 / NBRC 109087 / DQS3-9A1) TaxID=443218 RepID=F6ER26_HOYSD|nr:long-chain fatty acid--CoA ligase [Hoyosella subflava]AEF40713.1 Feruloyl-CoA synthetase [Hoyosella subflava DQS3-9A1]